MVLESLSSAKGTSTVSADLCAVVTTELSDLELPKVPTVSGAFSGGIYSSSISYVSYVSVTYSREPASS